MSYFSREFASIIYFVRSSVRLICQFAHANFVHVYKLKTMWQVLQAVDVYTVDNRVCENWHVEAGIRYCIIILVF